MTTLKEPDIEALIELFERSNWDEMHLNYHGTELFLSKDAGTAPIDGSALPHDGESAASQQGSSRQPEMAIPDRLRAATQPESNEPKASASAGDLTAVRAPSLGSFYSAPRPGSPPFVSIGAQVEPDTEVCLLEVMKMFTTVRAGVRGIVKEVCVSDGELVEHGQTLFRVEEA